MNGMVLKLKRRKKELNRENVMTRLLQLNVICRNFKFSFSASFCTSVYVDKYKKEFYTYFDEKYCHCRFGAQPPLVKLICIYIMLKEVLGLQIFACLHILTAHTEDDKEAFTCGVKTAEKKVKIFILPDSFISPHISGMYKDFHGDFLTIIIIFVSICK